MSAQDSCLSATLTLAFLLLAPALCRAQVSDNLLKNPSFEEGLTEAERPIPVQWTLYGGDGTDQHITLVEPGETGKYAVLIDDGDAAKEIGLHQTVPCEGELTYEAAVKVKAVEGAQPGGSHLQLRFSPSGEYAQTGLAAVSSQEFEEVSVRKTAPAGTESATIYLYTHRDPTPKVIVDSVRLISGVEPPPPPPPPPPEPIPPQYDKLKDLHLTTPLVQDGKANVTIIAPASGVYDQQASAIAAAIERLTGAKVPVETDDSPAAAVPIEGSLIVLGNRSTSKTIEQLYNAFYTLLDLRYPGAGGHVVRTLHNPFGDGRNVVFVGGSDTAGVEAATQVLIGKLNEAGARQGALAIGRLAEIKLGDGIEVPTDVRELEIWEASRGYGSTGYFGWCSISKRMAAYYMTGDEFHAREALRLSFPDEQALRDITEIDEERIENKDDPLAGFYHYNAHMAILFWDLIEESPVFSDEERLQVTNAFARQLNHRKNEGIYRLTGPPGQVGSRHGQYSAISLYCLGRYFNKDYPSPIWEQCVRGAQLHFAPLREHAWVSGESDNLFWYNTGTAPILTYMLLSGDRGPLEGGSLQTLLRGQEMLISGLVPDWALNSAAMDYLHKAAYLTGDGRWVEYRDRTGVDLSVFRLGQSFWPDESLQPEPPADLVGRWSINYLPKPLWVARQNGFPFEESFLFGSFRSAPDASGDFILLDGFNGASRNPYHTFDVLELRLDGHTLLKGYGNQVLTRADGMVEPSVAMNGALRYQEVLGETAAAVGEVPNAAYCNWRRSLVQRIGRHALVVDDLTFRLDSDNIELQTQWETAGGAWRPEQNALEISSSTAVGNPPGWHTVRALRSDCTSEPAGAEFLVALDSIGTMLLRGTEPGQYLDMAFELPEAVEGEVFADFVDYVDRGVVRLFLDGERVGEDYDNRAQSVERGRAALGRHTLAAGQHRLRAQVAARHPDLDKAYVGLVGLSIRPEGAPETGTPTVFAVMPSDLVTGTRSGNLTTMQWFGPARADQHLIFFSLIARKPEGDADAAGCVRVGDNAAALSLPAPALAVAGEYGAIKADLAVLAADHLYAQGLTSAGVAEPIITAAVPLAVDWDFASGTLHVIAAEDTTLQLRLAAAAGVTLDGQAAQGQPVEGGLVAFKLPQGRHLLEGAQPEGAALQRQGERMAGLLQEGRDARARLAAAGPAVATPDAPPLAEQFAAEVGGRIVDLVTIPGDAGRLICAAEGTTVHVLSPDGQELRALQADGDIRMLRWWEEHRLLLVGCADEKVIAFDTDGNRKWTFVSEMDPAVFRAAKQYWFKSAHPGIWGLHSGVFIDGKSQAFVGSACTLEIIDENGQLVHRMPQFWGDPWVFRLIPQADDSVNLLAARRTNGGDSVIINNSRTLDPNRRGFYSTPPGHSFVGGWSSINRAHLLYEDLDGDGVKEVISDHNGTWNRVTVYPADGGRALYNAQFGPGVRMPARNMRDLDVADLDGDGKKEILAATSSGLIVALDHQCQRVWVTRLHSPPNVMQAFVPEGAATPWIVVGCEDGTVVVLDGTGAAIRVGRLNGRPVCIAALDPAGTPVAVLATDQGEVKAFRLGTEGRG